MTELRKMEHDDIAAGLSLCRKNRWNQTARDWEIFLQCGPDDCCVAYTDNIIEGTVTTMRYDHFFSWIGMVLVDPEYQGKGIGMQLLHAALRMLKDEETIKLDATPAGRQVYRKLHFQDEYPLNRMEAVITGNKLPVSAARKIQLKDLPALVEFDRQIFGAPRGPLLKWLLEGAPQHAFLVESCNGINGYCLGRAGNHFAQIGPVIASDTDTAIQLLAAGLKDCTDKPFIIDVLNHNSEWLEFLASLGFTIQKPFTRMFLGSNRFAGQPGKQYAIAGPEYG